MYWFKSKIAKEYHCDSFDKNCKAPAVYFVGSGFKWKERGYVEYTNDGFDTDLLCTKCLLVFLISDTVYAHDDKCSYKNSIYNHYRICA